MLSAGAERRSSEILRGLSQQDRDMLIALPYRVGLYVSMSDQTGGDQAQEQEIQRLNAIIREISEDFCKSEIMQKIMAEAYARRGDAMKWGGALENVPQECERVADLLIGRVEMAGDITSVRDILIDIAVAVAMVYREGQGSSPAAEKAGAGGIAGFLKKLVRPDPRVDQRFLHPNISPQERQALITLSKALGGISPLQALAYIV